MDVTTKDVVVVLESLANMEFWWFLRWKSISSMVRGETKLDDGGVSVGNEQQVMNLIENIFTIPKIFLTS